MKFSAARATSLGLPVNEEMSSGETSHDLEPRNGGVPYFPIKPTPNWLASKKQVPINLSGAPKTHLTVGFTHHGAIG